MASEVLLLDQSDIIKWTLVDEFFKYLDVKQTSSQTYMKGIRQFVKWIEVNGIKSPSREDVLAFRNHLKEHFKPSTTQTYIVALRRFFSWTSQNEKYPNIAQKVKGAKIPRGHKKDELPAEAIRLILNKIPQDDIVGKRDFAMISLMAKCGLRVCEVVRANVEDLRNGYLYIQGKGMDGKDDFVVVPERVENALRSYLSSVDGKDGQPLFMSLSNRNKQGRMTTINISRIVKTHLRKNGYNSNRITAHSFRHSAITLALGSGATLQQAQQLARHSNINTTMIYAHNITARNNPCTNLIDEAIGV